MIDPDEVTASALSARGSAPLEGVVVVDLSRYLPGPLTAKLLADLGARVLKVEEPRAGDPVRMAPPLVGSGLSGKTSALATLLLSGVESIALDLKEVAARDVLHELLECADVLLETFRPGTLERLGFAPEELRRRHPQLVVASLSGFGANGPHAGRAGHDLTYQALAGSLAPTVRVPAVPVADHAGAWSAALSILAALYRRDAGRHPGRSSGQSAEPARGSHIETSLYDAALHANLVNWAAEGAGPQPVGKRSSLSGSLPCYNLYGTADRGYVAIACLEPHFWKRLCAVLGQESWVKRQYDTATDFKREVQKVVGQKTRQEWADLAERHDLPLDPVLSAAEATDHPQARARAVVGRGPDDLLRLAFPARFDGERPEAGERMPKLGEDTESVLEELGVEMDHADRRSGGVGQRGRLKRAVKRWVVGKKGPKT